MEQTERSASGPRRPSRFRGWRLFAVAFALAVIILVVIRNFFFEVYFIPSESMQPILEPGDRIVVNRTIHEVHRGDVIVFDGTGSYDPYMSASPWLSHPVKTTAQWLGLIGSDTVYVKRVIGVAGDTVQCCSANGKLLVNGQEVDEPYIFSGDKSSEQRFTVTVPTGRMWVMGDHRSNSRDSRDLLAAPGGGMIRTEKVIGEPVAVLWPIARWKTFD